MIKLGVHVDSHVTTTRERDTDDSWDRGSTSTTWYVNSIALPRKLENEYKSGGPRDTIDYEGEVNLGDEMYLLYAVYSTGDSFGHDADGMIDFISVHKDPAVAQYNHDQLNGASGTVKLKSDDGTEWNYYVPWNGYFESLSYINVDSFNVSIR